MATPDRTSDKGACGAQWGPGCTGADSPDGNHLCQLPRGHTEQQCQCYYDGLKQIVASRPRV